MNDVAPALKARVQKAFRDGLEKQAALKGLSEKNSLDYTDARAYGEAVGGELAEAFKQISGDDLPNGHMYYNIAEKVVVPLIDEAYATAADYCEKTQNALNEKAGLGIKAVRPELDPERTYSIVNKLDATEKFEDAKWILDDAVQNVVSSASDTSIKANAEAQYRAGLRPKVTRDSGGKCCDWCAALDGVYYYPDVPKEVYARHNNCTCSVEYSPSEGRRQDVWSKKWQGDAEPAAILSRAEAAKANEAARDARDAEQRAERIGLAASDGVGIVFPHDPPVELDPVDIKNQAAVTARIEAFERAARNYSTEHALVITRDGRVFECFGNERAVWPGADLPGMLEGAHITHNHVKEYTEYSLSKDDRIMFLENGLSVLRGTDFKYTYQMDRSGLADTMPDGLDPENVQHEKRIEEAKMLGFGYRRWENDS